LLSFVLADSALELVPKEIRRSAAVQSDSKRRGADASEILLDRSFHHSAMSKLKDSEKRGRPDLVHVALLSVTGAPLYLDGQVRLFVHTYAGMVLEIAEKTRIPKNYIRFRGLAEQALVGGNTTGLVRAYPMKFGDLMRKASAGRVFGLSVQGKREDASDLAREVVSARSPCIVVGGFPRGHFSIEVAERVDELVRIDERPLEAHVVASRVIYEVERAAKRFND
jgi:rRNA small subunit pseudouridine methyltransferase Nep1